MMKKVQSRSLPGHCLRMPRGKSSVSFHVNLDLLPMTRMWFRMMFGNAFCTLILIYQSMCMWRGPDGEENADVKNRKLSKAQKWAEESGGGSMSMATSYRRMSEQHLYDAMDPSVKMNSVMPNPEPQIPGQLIDIEDDDEMMT